MQKESELKQDDLKYIAIISLRRSKTKRKIVDYLSRIYPKLSYPAEIGFDIRITSPAVLGSLTGSGPRYDKDTSLVGLGLVEEVRTDADRKFKLYRITTFGRLILESDDYKRMTKNP